MNDPFKEIEKRLTEGGNTGGEAENWRPEPGDKLIGTVRHRGVLNGQYGPTPTLKVEDREGKMWSVLCGSKILKDWIEESDPRAGDAVGIEYTGKKSNKAGTSSYHHYITDHVRVSATQSSEDEWV